MATPVKSPLQKKHRGDEPLSEDVIITGVSDGVERGAVSLEAIEKLLDRKLDPLNQFLSTDSSGSQRFQRVCTGGI